MTNDSDQREHSMPNPMIIGAARTAVGKARKGSLINYRPDDLAALAMKAVLERTPKIKPEDIDAALDILHQPAE